MINNDLISIVVPVYNVEKYVKYCVESIVNQKYNNLEIILVDDGSTDNSGKICDEYSKLDNRIKVIHKENGGLADARNVGISYATGEYIGFVDSDDYIHPDFYQTLYDLLLDNNADISECQFLRIAVEKIEDAKNILDSENSKVVNEYKIEKNIDALRNLYGPRLKPYIQKVVVWNKLYKKSLFNDVEFPVGKLHEDEFTTYKILSKCTNIVSTNLYLHGYMQTKNSIMRNVIKQKRIDDNLGAYEEAVKFFDKLGNYEIENKVLRRYMENCVELAGKVFKEESDDKEQKLVGLTDKYKEYYTLYYQRILSNVTDSREYEIMDLLKEAFEDKEHDYINPIYWDKLERIINKN